MIGAFVCFMVLFPALLWFRSCSEDMFSRFLFAFISGLPCSPFNLFISSFNCCLSVYSSFIVLFCFLFAFISGLPCSPFNLFISSFNCCLSVYSSFIVLFCFSIRLSSTINKSFVDESSIVFNARSMAALNSETLYVSVVFILLSFATKINFY